ncbi:MAG TPA: hypothetical protein VMR52_05815 [Dehalococcoidia bacterium]|nr:hypothetical protein [Dehalococcoidia bacterium]
MTDWQVLLLGGTTASGKSTTGRIVADRLGVGYVSGDSVWRAILAVTTAETHPLLHEWPRANEDPGEAEGLAQLHIAEAKFLTPALDAFLEKELMEGARFVFHCAWITPGMAAGRCASAAAVRAVFIDDQSEESITAAILRRSRRTEPTHRQIVMAKTSALYGEWLAVEAERFGVPLVAALPRESLADRVIEAATSGWKVTT